MANFPMIIVNQDLPLVLSLSPNPNSISMDRSKIFSKTQTVGGWVFEHWGEQPRVLKCRGRTQAVLGSQANNPLIFPGKNTVVGVEAALFALQQIYNLDKRPPNGLLQILKSAVTRNSITSGNTNPSILPPASTFIYYKLDLYQGFFTHFSFRQEAERMPRHYEYEFEFLVTANAQNSLASSILGTSLAPLISLATSGPAAAVVAGAGVLSGITGLNLAG